MFFSCEAILENAIENNSKEEPALVVIIKNNTPYLFERTEVITDDGIVVFQIIDPGSYDISDYFLSIYDDIEIRIQTKNSNFYHKPLYYNEASKVVDGRYTFNISISDDNELIINRVKH
ncbi:hypothetical protein [Changchengzhania lutea]|uniref:hypothetical protein n=1 Tax=Changchengzhania lutea TaxID=2049305 RepID=UPI00163D6EE0|nr:hypothetical protein [Changchengzhania lutea]